MAARRTITRRHERVKESCNLCNVAALCVGMLWGMAGCATNLPLTFEPVGPQRPGGLGPTGQLMVLTATERVNSGGFFYDHHTPYLVLDQVGKKVVAVQNYAGVADQVPMMTTLPTGHYTVVGQAEAYGQVRVPVVIQGGRLTEVNLQRGGIPRNQLQAGANLVRFPNGDVMGWRAQDQERAR